MRQVNASRNSGTDNYIASRKRPVIGSIDWFLGFGLGLPFVFPDAPWYWAGFAIMIAGALRCRFDNSVAVARLSVCAACMVYAILANIFSPFPDMFRLATVLPSIFFFTFYLFGHGVRDQLSFLHGFSLMVTIYAGLVIFAFFYLEVYDVGLQLFLVSADRLWGEKFFYDWPNMLSILFGLGCLVNFLVFKRLWMGALALCAAIMTTSRSVAVAVALLVVFAVYKAIASGKRKYQFLIAVSLLGIGGGVFLFWDGLTDAAVILSRLSKTADREVVYRLALEMIAQNPMMGIGSVQYGSISDYVESFHNSYLKVGTRFGIPGLLLFAALVVPIRIRRGLGFEYILLLVYLPILALVQDALQHPHLAMLHSVFIVIAANELGQQGDRAADYSGRT